MKWAKNTKCDEDPMKDLVQFRCLIDDQNKYDQTALMVPVKNHCMLMVSGLIPILNRSQNPDVFTEVTNKLMISKPNVTPKTPKYGQTALMMAAIKGQSNIIKVLIDNGAKQNSYPDLIVVIACWVVGVSCFL